VRRGWGDRVLWVPRVTAFGAQSYQGEEVGGGRRREGEGGWGGGGGKGGRKGGGRGKEKRNHHQGVRKDIKVTCGWAHGAPGPAQNG
jgi:hypothetical protein